MSMIHGPLSELSDQLSALVRGGPQFEPCCRSVVIKAMGSHLRYNQRRILASVELSSPGSTGGVGSKAVGDVATHRRRCCLKKIFR